MFFLEIGKILSEKIDEEYMYVCVEKNNLWIKVGEIEFITQLIDKKFPDFSIIIPKKGYKHLEIKIKKEILLPTLRRMSIISQEHNTPVVFSFHGFSFPGLRRVSSFSLDRRSRRSRPFF